MPRKRDDIEAALIRKGFKLDNSHHRYFKYFVNGVYTGAYTFTSHGSSYKVYGDALLAKMGKQLKLDDKKQLLRLIDCPMTEEEYRKHLHKKGIISCP